MINRRQSSSPWATAVNRSTRLPDRSVKASEWFILMWTACFCNFCIWDMFFPTNRKHFAAFVLFTSCLRMILMQNQMKNSYCLFIICASICFTFVCRQQSSKQFMKHVPFPPAQRHPFVPMYKKQDHVSPAQSVMFDKSLTHDLTCLFSLPRLSGGWMSSCPLISSRTSLLLQQREPKQNTKCFSDRGAPSAMSQHAWGTWCSWWHQGLIWANNQGWWTIFI